MPLSKSSDIPTRERDFLQEIPLMKYVFIAGLSHSGSTLVDLSLGGHPNFIGLGELALVARKGPSGLAALREELCSCGNTMDSCVFWKPVLNRIAAQQPVSFQQTFEIIVNLFAEIFGPEKTIVDSSKYLPNLKWIHENHQAQIKVLHVIRDVRSFVVSQIDNQQRKGRPYSYRSRFEFFWRWYAGNRRIGEYLKEENLPHLRLGYEEFCFYPDVIAEKICDFLGVQFHSDMLSPGVSESHSVLGNRMRHQATKKKIRYDHRWMTRNEWVIPSLIFRKVMRFNSLYSYSDGMKETWKK
jgi:hypothetical protein